MCHFEKCIHKSNVGKAEVKGFCYAGSLHALPTLAPRRAKKTGLSKKDKPVAIQIILFCE